MQTVSIIIAFETGFSNDNVIGQINNREVFQRKGLTTNPMLGYAGSVKVNIDESAKTMVIVIPTKGIYETIPLKLPEITNIAIRLEDKKITYRFSEEPLGYL
jgi:hypothetical protein